MPNTKPIKYKKRRKYKYNLHIDVEYATGITGKAGGNPFLEIDAQGMLNIKSGYSWDGPSGPAIDTKTFMRGSLVHDALYQLIREEVLPQSDRDAADDILIKICKEDGMTALRRWWVKKAVKSFAKRAAKPDMREAP